MGEQPGAHADAEHAGAEQRRGIERGGKDHGRERRRGPATAAIGGEAVGVAAAGQQPGPDGEADEAADREHRRHCRGGADAEAQHVAAIGLEQDILHAERERADAERHEAATRLRPGGKDPPGGAEGGPGDRLAAGGATPVSTSAMPFSTMVAVRRALDHLDEAELAEMG